jgi:hypothetical protein
VRLVNGQGTNPRPQPHPIASESPLFIIRANELLPLNAKGKMWPFHELLLKFEAFRNIGTVI